MKARFYLYILSGENNKVLYIGTTYDLVKRIYEHKLKVGYRFTAKYNLTKLVYYEYSEDMYTILNRERLIKRWKRTWKNQLIDKFNPNWKDLYHTLQ